MREVHLKVLQYLTGAGLFFLVGLHFLVSHLGSGHPESWAEVSRRAASSGWLAVYVLILLFGLYHGLHGLRAVLMEFSLPRGAIRILNWTLVLGGAAVFGYALYIPVNAFLA
ncbi:MAG: hypothetical protein IBX68_04470 [Dehalococcoidia bacterium]|nr:hypothetical protein [Dehalococcoidia bacterium]